ncbi:MAG: aspartate--ammonia ligase [Proteobacteria bacterium]|nr:aspartate--ammonia ligase [Pseudomonadota bacterium]
MEKTANGDKTKYQSVIDLRETERAIHVIKKEFQTNLAANLNLYRVTAPLFVLSGTGINDNLNGIERPVSFEIKSLGNARAEIVQSLAKWKRMALADYGFKPGEGLYTDMNAIRPDEELDDIHSIYVDQWDWERVITAEDRNLDFLYLIVKRIYDAIRRTEQHVSDTYAGITPELPDSITFIHTTELNKLYPDLTPKERENRICKEKGAVFIIGIGAPLNGGKPHDGRAPDYDDWITPTELGPGLNGDIVVWNPVLGRAFELSSMGIRVDAKSLKEQLAVTGTEERIELWYHQQLLKGELPLCIGGGIGQSRLCMLFLKKKHVGEVQRSIWSGKINEQHKFGSATML